MKKTLEKNIARTGNSKSSFSLPLFAVAAFAFFATGAHKVFAACDVSGWKYCNPLEGTVGSLSDAGTKTVQALLGLIGTIALLLLVIAGISYMTAAGDVNKVANARKIITGTIAGLGIALIAYSLLLTVSQILTVK